MIAWMQKNNKYLVPTIWIATIAFIGAGAVGWGSMNFGEKSSSVAKVGDITISKNKYIFTYNNIYNQYVEKFGNKFDRKVAKELNLDKQVLNSLITQAYLLNLAKEYGIIVSDKEIAKEIINFPIFKDKNGLFQKSYYQNFLRARGLREKDFEKIIKDDLIVNKLLTLINKKAVKFEKDVISSTLLIADKIKYDIISSKDINVTLTDNEIRKYWEKNKLNYLTPEKYKVGLLVTKTDDINITDAEINKYYKENSFDFVDKNGKTLALNEVKDKIIQAIKLKKAKKKALIQRSRFKKGKIKATKVLELAKNDKFLSKKIWSNIQNAKIGDFLKPQELNSTLVTIHLIDIKKPEQKTFEEAKSDVRKDLLPLKAMQIAQDKAKYLLQNNNKLKFESKDYISLSKFQILPSLTLPESQKVIKYIFEHNKKRDIVKLNNSFVAYDIIDQKILDKNKNNINLFNKEIDSIKKSEFETNLIANLAKKYKVVKF